MDMNVISVEKRKTYEYRGFVIEPITGGWVIVVNGRKHKFYLAGDKGMDLTQDYRKAKAFRTTEFSQQVIDEHIKDHNDWLISLTTKKKIIV